jgi:hypothetical protein
VADPPKPSGGDDTWKTYSPPVSQPIPETPAVPDTPETLPPTHVPYGRQSYSGTYPAAPGTTVDTVLSSDLVSTRTAAKGCGVVGLVISLVVFIPLIFGVIVAIRAISGGWDELKDGMGDPFSSAEKPDLHSTAGFNDMVGALKAEMGGSTTVFDVVLYPEYAVVSVPADTTSKRYYSYYYDGDLRRTSQGSTDDTRFDITTIDSNVLVKLLNKAETLVEDPTSVYAIISAPQEFDQGAWFSVYASNSFQESSYFTADKTGKIIQTTVSP